ncbi:MAG TPA: hypothetical protein DDW83_01905, partial [Peptococcaceae bacterium]|nr:hypothetical protein [Peptococcaceae bacterium]
ANTTRDCWRRRKREGEAIPIPFDETTVAADQRFSPESISEAKDIKQIVEEAVASLPWEYRTAIVLRHFQDLSC